MSSLVQIQVRRDTAANWTIADPVLALAEPALETDTQRIKFGDGVNAWSSLPYFSTDKNFVFTQGTASAVWNVAHNLGKFPSPVIIDSGGNEIEGEINHTDINNLIITFSTAFTGKAYIN
jgi:hypothetical protein